MGVMLGPCFLRNAQETYAVRACAKAFTCSLKPPIRYRRLGAMSQEMTPMHKEAPALCTLQMPSAGAPSCARRAAWPAAPAPARARAFFYGLTLTLFTQR